VRRSLSRRGEFGRTEEATERKEQERLRIKGARRRSTGRVRDAGAGPDGFEMERRFIAANFTDKRGAWEPRIK
jgi:hypothetical protein